MAASSALAAPLKAMHKSSSFRVLRISVLPQFGPLQTWRYQKPPFFRWRNNDRLFRKASRRISLSPADSGPGRVHNHASHLCLVCRDTKKPVLRRVWPVARDNAMAPNVQNEFCYTHAVNLWTTCLSVRISEYLRVKLSEQASIASCETSLLQIHMDLKLIVEVFLCINGTVSLKQKEI